MHKKHHEHEVTFVLSTNFDSPYEAALISLTDTLVPAIVLTLTG